LEDMDDDEEWLTFSFRVSPKIMSKQKQKEKEYWYNSPNKIYLSTYLSIFF
jgi:hypothetical protein